MSDDNITKDNQEKQNFFTKHRFGIFISISMVVTSVMVWVSMSIYNNSGAAQLDLSRPGYVSVSSQVTTDGDDYSAYSTSGSLNKAAIDEFLKTYDEQSQKAKDADAFSDDPLNPETLNLTL